MGNLIGKYSPIYDDSFVEQILAEYQDGSSMKQLRKKYQVTGTMIKGWATKAGITITETISYKMYGWSKYGGASEGLVKEELDIWHCQSCTKEQSKHMPQYMIPLDQDEREYARVCTVCKKTALIKKAMFFHELTKHTRKKSIYA